MEATLRIWIGNKEHGRVASLLNSSPPASVSAAQVVELAAPSLATPPPGSPLAEEPLSKSSSGAPHPDAVSSAPSANIASALPRQSEQVAPGNARAGSECSPLEEPRLINFGG